ncbi:MAG TPA: hypothetical protein VMV41_00070 [Cellulomonadaceae bacterium]|nr:hypothetical protein [Cellulomonadaceae bacterium]
MSAKYVLILTEEQRQVILDALASHAEGTPVVEVESDDLDKMAADFSTAGTYLARFVINRHGLSVKVNEYGWSPSFGSLRHFGGMTPKIVAALDLHEGLDNLKPEDSPLAAMLKPTVA